jgi:hypothetical protein
MPYGQTRSQNDFIYRGFSQILEDSILYNKYF